MALEENFSGDQSTSEVPELKKRNKEFRELLLSITPKENIEYIHEGRTPYHFSIDGAKASFLTHWDGFYEVNGVSLKLPETEEQLRADIKFVKERKYNALCSKK